MTLSGVWRVWWACSTGGGSGRSPFRWGVADLMDSAAANLQCPGCTVPLEMKIIQVWACTPVQNANLQLFLLQVLFAVSLNAKVHLFSLLSL
ncbi:MAG: hypothetical protein K0Q90_756 [Paenibacillaceae bacterium]|nr:hypothetical protein [Paenibacillaceae bacterium]